MGSHLSEALLVASYQGFWGFRKVALSQATSRGKVLAPRSQKTIGLEAVLGLLTPLPSYPPSSFLTIDSQFFCILLARSEGHGLIDR